MLKVIQAEWFHVVHRRQTWIVLAGAVVVMTLSLGAARGYDYHSAYLAYLAALGGGANPVWLAVLPLVGSFVMGDVVGWERRTGLLRSVRSRQPLGSLIVGQLIATLLFTLLLVAVVLAVTLCLSLVLLPPMPPWHHVATGRLTITVPGPPTAYTPYPTFLHALFFMDPLGYLFIFSGIVLLATAFWGLLSLAISSWTTNTYIILGGPWLLYVGLSYIFGAPLHAVLGGWMPIQLAGAFVASSPLPAAWLIGIWPLALGLVSGLTVVSFWVRERVSVD